MHKVWSTAEVHPRDRLAYWIQGICNTIAGVECEPRRGARFFGHICSATAERLQAAKYSSSAQILTRTPRKIAQRPTDLLSLGIQMSGYGLGSQDGRDTELLPGDLVLYDMTRPLRLRFDSCFTRTTLLFPRSALERHIGASEQFIGTCIDGNTGIGAMLSPMLCELPSRLDVIPNAVRARVFDNVISLIATALLAQDESAHCSIGMTLVRVKLWVEVRLQHALSAEQISVGSGLSVRHLNRLFEREGTSLMRYVWERRLARCHRDLLDPAMRRRPVGEIAFAAGFSDLSHFSRAYRVRYGCAPRESRSSADRRGSAGILSDVTIAGDARIPPRVE